MSATIPTLTADPDLVRVIAQTESGGNQWALRFEPTTYAGIRGGQHAAACSVARVANKCSIATSQMLCSSSWGLFQIMGFNLWAKPGFVGPVGAFLGDVNAQGAALERFLIAAGLDGITWDEIADDETVRERFIVHYNGPGNPEAYWTLMRSAAKAIGLAV